MSFYSLNNTQNHFKEFYMVGHPVVVTATDMRRAAQTGLKNMALSLLSDDSEETLSYIDPVSYTHLRAIVLLWMICPFRILFSQRGNRAFLPSSWIRKGPASPPWVLDVYKRQLFMQPFPDKPLFIRFYYPAVKRMVIGVC